MAGLRGNNKHNSEMPFCGKNCCYNYRNGTERKKANKRLRTREKRELLKELQNA